MKTRVVSARAIEPDDWFFLAGVLYRIYSVFAEPNGDVEIKFFDHEQSQREEETILLDLKVKRHTVFQILNQ